MQSSTSEIEKIIEDYKRSVAEEDKHAASKNLELLESDQFQTEANWLVIEKFLRENNFKGRIEIITKRLIDSKSNVSTKPVLVLASLYIESKRINEAKYLLDAFKAKMTESQADKWEYVSLLFNLRLFQECLEILQKLLATDPSGFPYLITQAKCLWFLGEHRQARIYLKKMVPSIGDSSGNWLWYADLADLLREERVASIAVSELFDRILDGRCQLSWHVVRALRSMKRDKGLLNILMRCSIENYKNMHELEEIFEIFDYYGLVSRAQAIGNRILEKSPEHTLKKKITNLQNSDFLAIR